MYPLFIIFILLFSLEMRFLILLDQETSSSSYFRGDSSLLEPQNELITQAKAVNPIQILIGTRIRHASLSPLVCFILILFVCLNVLMLFQEMLLEAFCSETSTLQRSSRVFASEGERLVQWQPNTYLVVQNLCVYIVYLI